MRRFLSVRTAWRRMGQDHECAELPERWRYEIPRRYPWIACSLIVAAIAGFEFGAGVAPWPGPLAAVVVGGGAIAYALLYWYTASASRRRVICAADRILPLAASLPRRTDKETLAVLGEIRARYDETLSLANKIWPVGDRFASNIRCRLYRIDRVYDAEGGCLLYGNGNVAKVARDVRRFSMEIGSMRID